MGKLSQTEQALKWASEYRQPSGDPIYLYAEKDCVVLYDIPCPHGRRGMSKNSEVCSNCDVHTWTAETGFSEKDGTGNTLKAAIIDAWKRNNKEMK
jgi:hypothetical protein